METSRDWKEQAREVLLNGALEYIYPAQDIRDLELRAYYVVASFGRIMDARQEKLLDYLQNYQGNYEQIKEETIERVKTFLKRVIK